VAGDAVERCPPPVPIGYLSAWRRSATRISYPNCLKFLVGLVMFG